MCEWRGCKCPPASHTRCADQPNPPRAGARLCCLCQCSCTPVRCGFGVRLCADRPGPVRGQVRAKVDCVSVCAHLCVVGLGVASHPVLSSQFKSAQVNRECAFVRLLACSHVCACACLVLHLHQNACWPRFASSSATSPEGIIQESGQFHQHLGELFPVYSDWRTHGVTHEHKARKRVTKRTILTPGQAGVSASRGAHNQSRNPARYRTASLPR